MKYKLTMAQRCARNRSPMFSAQYHAVSIEHENDVYRFTFADKSMLVVTEVSYGILEYHTY
jgi:hypothetical protein